MRCCAQQAADDLPRIGIAREDGELTRVRNARPLFVVRAQTVHHEGTLAVLWRVGQSPIT